MKLNDLPLDILSKNELSLSRSLFAMFSPQEKMSTSDWAQEYLYLSSEEGPEAGLYSAKNVPWQIEIMNSLDEIGVESMVFMGPSQVGKSTIVKAIMGRHVHQDPCPILCVQPVEGMAKTFSNNRVATMFRDCPVFKNVLTKDDVNEKSFVGGYIAMAWAQSPSSIASRPIRLLVNDEVDRWVVSSGNEGDPLKIAEARTQNFWNRKIATVSSPTTESGRINRAFLETDQRHYHVPCLHCEYEHEPDFIAQLRMVDEDPQTAMLACPSCGSLYGDAELPKMVQRGRWIAKYPMRKKRGYNISRLMTPNWTKLSHLAEEYIEAKRFPELLQVFINTKLGKVFKDKQGQISNADELAERRENYDHRTLPAEILFITAGVDVQDDRLEIEVLAHADEEESWGAQYITLLGDPSEKQVWKQLDALLLTEFYTVDNRTIRISAACVDSGGHHTQMVYDFCKRRAKRKIWAIKGVGGAKPIWPSHASRSKAHKKFLVRLIGVDTVKDTLFSRLRTEEPGPGYCHFPFTYDGEIYFSQLTAERRVATWDKSGKQIFVWVKEKHARNEALDCRVYAWAAYHGLVQECRMNIKQLASMRQYSLFKGDPLTSDHANLIAVEAAPAIPQVMQTISEPVIPASSSRLKGRRRASSSSYLKR